MNVDLQELHKRSQELLEQAGSEAEANQLLFSKNQLFDSYIQQVKTLPKEQWGGLFVEIEKIKKVCKEVIYEKFAPKKQVIMKDSTIETFYEPGKLHPISVQINLMREIMSSYGFIEIDAPIVDEEYYNFDGINVHELHPARGNHDTFYLKSDKLLRTHTTNAAVRAFEQFTHAPLKTFHIGQVYRRDDDRTHSPMFHQLEGYYLDEFDKVNLAHLKWFLRELIESVLGQKNLKLRFRPSYFPFTEPGIEADVMCVRDKDSLHLVHEGESHKGAGWMEILGAGMFCQDILKRGNYQNHTAFAFGMGVDRIAMLRYGIANINDMYKNEFPFLRKSGIEGVI